MKPIMVTRSSMPELEEYIEEIKDIWNSHWLTNMGLKHNQLEEELACYLGTENLSLFTNGHLALELALQGMNLTGEVITTPFTFASTTHAIMRNGLTPVFCDINPENYTIDVLKLESMINDKTSAIVPVHVYGNICEVDEINRIALKYGLKVIYDAAHAFGVRLNGYGIGSYGDASVFSFHATKVYNTIEGGAVTFRNQKLKNLFYQLKNFGISLEDTVDSIGMNAKMSEFQAAMGICNLRHIDGEIRKRKIAVEQYRKNLDGIPGLKLMKEVEGVKSNYAYFPVIIDETLFGYTRDEISDRLIKNNIFPRKYFYPLTNTFPCYNHRLNPGDTPVARQISLRVLALPLFADLPLADVDRICDIILRDHEK
ncbi:MAG: DegT/DnrJ/EryC1/StrS family aminotransferase [Anaerocolumna sp.]